MTQTKAIQLLPDIWAVEVPKDSSEFEVIGDYPHMCNPELWFWHQAKNFHIDLPPGEWTILFTTDELTEDQAAGIVEKDNGKYKDYSDVFPDNMIPYDYASDSLFSLLRSKGLDTDKNYLILQNKK